MNWSALFGSPDFAWEFQVHWKEPRRDARRRVLRAAGSRESCRIQIWAFHRAEGSTCYDITRTLAGDQWEAMSEDCESLAHWANGKGREVVDQWLAKSFAAMGIASLSKEH